MTADAGPADLGRTEPDATGRSGGRIAYVDPVSGAAGDMLLGALLDAGLSLDDLLDALAPLARPLDASGGWALRTEAVTRNGFPATRAVVTVAAEQPPRTVGEIRALLSGAGLHPADVAGAERVLALLGAAEAVAHGRVPGVAPLDSVPLDSVPLDSLPLDAAQLDAMHLHEVGAADAIIDIVGVVAGLRLLGVERLHVGPLPIGGGTVTAAHGVLPVPAPAVAWLLAHSGLSVAPSDPAEPRMELVTPTGAALLAALATPGRPAMRAEAIGSGAGGRDTPGWPNVLRLWLGRSAEPGTLQPGGAAPGGAAPGGPESGGAESGGAESGGAESGGAESGGPESGGAESGGAAPATVEPDGSAGTDPTVRPLVIVAANVDDMPPEHVPYLIDRLLEAGALDAWWTPAGMKKRRPGVEVTAVARPQQEAAVARAMLRHSSTLGVRVTEARRWEASRRLVQFTSTLGEATVKVRDAPGAPGAEGTAGMPHIAPEYEVAAALALRHDLPLAEVYRRLTAEAAEHLLHLDRSEGDAEQAD